MEDLHVRNSFVVETKSLQWISNNATTYFQTLFNVFITFFNSEQALEDGLIIRNFHITVDLPYISLPIIPSGAQLNVSLELFTDSRANQFLGL